MHKGNPHERATSERVQHDTMLFGMFRLAGLGVVQSIRAGWVYGGGVAEPLPKEVPWSSKHWGVVPGSDDHRRKFLSKDIYCLAERNVPFDFYATPGRGAGEKVREGAFILGSVFHLSSGWWKPNGIFINNKLGSIERNEMVKELRKKWTKPDMIQKEWEGIRRAKVYAGMGREQA